MLVTLRNSGANGIQYNKITKDEVLLKLANEADNGGGFDMFFQHIDLDSFVIQKEDLVLLHLNLNESMMSGEKRYEIILETDTRHYRLYYHNGKPGFFKKLFQYFYPDDADAQVEELI